MRLSCQIRCCQDLTVRILRRLSENPEMSVCRAATGKLAADVPGTRRGCEGRSGALLTAG